MRIALLCILLLVAVPARAQTPPEFELPEVIIPGRRPQPLWATPASVSVLTREELEALGIETLAEALQLFPEVFIRTYGAPGSLAEASLRGFGPGQVLVLLDGVPLNNVALGQADLSTISLVGLQRIEVLRGPFAALAGSGAVGGVINIVTGAVGSTAAVRYGSRGERWVSLTRDLGPWSLGLDAGGADGDRPNSDAAEVTLRADARFGQALRLSLHHHRSDVGTPGDIGAPTPSDRQSTARTVVQGQWNGTAGRARGYATVEKLVFQTPFGSSTYRAVTAGGEFQRQWTLRPQRVLVAGVELQGQRLRADVFGAAILEDAFLGAAYAQYDAVLSERALASLGLRLDSHSRYGTALNPRAGLTVRVNEQTRIRVAAGRTFRGPTFLHLFFPGCSTPDLAPESAWAGEAGIERVTGRGMIGATVFAAEAVNLISSGCPPLNVGQASFRGVSLEGRARLGPGGVLLVNLTAQRAVDRATGDLLPRVPQLSANAALTYRLSETSSLVGILHYVGPRRDVDFSVVPAVEVDLPGYVDLGLRYQHRTAAGWNVTIGIDNVLDTRSEPVKGFPAPGRRVYFSASWRF